MNKSRWFLLIPLLISITCLTGAVFISIKGSNLNLTSMREEKNMKWHQKHMESNDPQILKSHSEHLWEILQNADEVAHASFLAIKSGLSIFIWISAINLICCAASFISSKNKTTEQAGAANPCACGTSVTEAACAPSVPEASRDI